MAKTLRESFDPRSNSIGFLRWLLAFVVIFSHAGPIGNFYGGRDLGAPWSTEQSFGGVAVAGFFFLSGYLITKSRLGSSTIFRFLWRRVLRIFPAFWASTLLIVFVFAPIAWWYTHGHSFSGYWSTPDDPPLGFLTKNLFLVYNQAGLGHLHPNTPIGEFGNPGWNGSAGTLIYEFKGYFVIALLGLFGMLNYKRLVLAFFGFVLVLNTLLFGQFGNPAQLTPLLNDYRDVMYLAPFTFGIVFALFGDVIRIDDRVAVFAACVGFCTYFIGSGWNLYGQFGFLYVVMWAAVRLPLTKWERFGDLSYGIYIYAWPLMLLAAIGNVQRYGYVVYMLTVIVLVHVLAWLSWHGLEKRALALKNWTPRWLAAILRGLQPAVDRVTAAIVSPDYSSTRFAARLRGDVAAVTGPAATDTLVSHDPRDRAR